MSKNTVGVGEHIIKIAKGGITIDRDFTPWHGIARVQIRGREVWLSFIGGQRDQSIAFTVGGEASDLYSAIVTAMGGEV